MEPGVSVEFVKHPVLLGGRSKAEGREIFEDRDYVRIRVAGNDKECYFQPVKEQDKLRFPEEWSAYCKGAEVVRTGTPIERWPQVTPAQVRNLKVLNVFTVEDLAAISDVNLHKLGPGASQLRNDAKRFLEVAGAMANQHEMDELRKANAEQAETIRQLVDKVERLSDAVHGAPEGAVAPGASAGDPAAGTIPVEQPQTGKGKKK